MELPKGGGAIRGLGETFKVNPATGTGSVGLPLPLSPSPRGPTPAVGLSYDSGSGNSPFGLGWSVGVPSITRKTDKKIPEYLDDEDSDLFLLSGAEDLVPVLDAAGAPVSPAPIVDGTATTTVRLYRPRVEGLFSIIERVTIVDTAASPRRTVHWRATTRDNVTSTFGTTAASRIADPAYDHKVYAWLLDRTADDRGNVVRYEYKGEDDASLPAGTPSEAQHVEGGAAPVEANRYLKRVLYGNVVMSAPEPEDFMFELVFDYGEHTTDTPDTPTDWACRPDIYSSFRSGFEVRTYRRCSRVLMFHHFSEITPGPSPRLVRALELTYNEGASAKRFSKLIEATLRGYDHDGTSYSSKTMPKVSFGYTPDAFSGSIRDLTKTDLGDDYPQSAMGTSATWVDLDQEGLPGILIEQAGSHRYKRNIGGVLQGAATLQSVPAVASRPAQLLDIAGSGTLSMVLKQGNESGYAERTAQGWAEFKPFKAFPNLDLNDPNVRFLDLNGDGFEDILVTRGDHLLWYPSLARDGYGHARRVDTPTEEERGPRVVFADPTAAVFIADMNGDGLADIVRVTHGGVVYWPNMGHGRFGAMVRMSTAPLLATTQFDFDARRVLLADLDGTGAADLCFFHEDGSFRVYRNESGNGFGEVELFPLPAEARHHGQFVDFYGTGTSAYVFYLPSHPGFLAKIWDPLDHKKPHLLEEVDNHQGKVTRLRYAASTAFYVQDRLAGRPWPTKLPFPVHVVDRVETYDAIRRARFVSTYTFHDGHYDTHEREFRGFGMVEQLDAEAFGADNGQGLFPSYPVVNDEMPQHPVLTKSWFHLGTEHALVGPHASTPDLECVFDPVPTTMQERREALRALRGSTRRTEIYELDGGALEELPYAVTTTSYEVRRLQPSKVSANPARPAMPGVFHMVDRESRSYAYERVIEDPRVSQTVALAVDDYGVVTRSAAVAYRRNDVELTLAPITTLPPEQEKTHVVVSESTVLHLDELEGDGGYRLGIPIRAQTYELTGVDPEAGEILTFEEIGTAWSGASAVAYETIYSGGPGSGLKKRLVQHELAHYYDDELTAALPTGEATPRALIYATYLLDITPGLLTDVYDEPDDIADSTELAALVTEAEYLTPTGESGHWLPSGRAVFDPEKFYLVSSITDPFDNETEIAYDTHAMFATSIEDARGNVVSVVHDYRTLSAKLVTDPNGNRQEASFDELGMITAMAVRGKTSESLGDTLADPTIEYSYDLTRWDTAQKPNWVKVKARETHGTSGTIKFQESKVFTDGSGGVVMTKAQAEPDPTTSDPRWVGSGRTVLNNKGNPVKQYEPYFSDNFDYEDEDDIVATGITAVITYDGLGRVERTDLPNGSFSMVRRTPWLELAYDPNDTLEVTLPGETTPLPNRWRDDRLSSASPPMSAEEQRALTLSLAHADTPTQMHFDSLGRAFLVIAHNIDEEEDDEFLETRSVLDIEGQVLEVKDPLERTCQTNVYSMAGKLLKETNIDKGARWYFHDVGGALIRKWDARGQRFRLTYDVLRRSTHLYCKQGSAAEMLLQRTVFGDSAGTGITDPAANNLRGKPIRVFDGAGRVKSESYDFKGNNLSSDRRLATEYATTPNWIDTVTFDHVGDIDSEVEAMLDGETFTESRTFDALNRIVTATTPDGSIFTPTYNEAGLLEAVDVDVRGEGSVNFVKQISYDAKGQRERIDYSADSTSPFGERFFTQYTYDEYTFRLTRVETYRVSPAHTLQDLRYTFDPVGNIVESTDGAQQDLLFVNEFPTVPNRYVYDAVYRLIRGEGREHKSVGDTQLDDEDQAIYNLPHPNDVTAIRSYFETYLYDKVGNILEMFHNAGSGANVWTRTYTYQTSPSSTNRLASHSAPGGSVSFSYDAHGSMTSMPHLASIVWTPFDQMKSSDAMGGGVVHFTYGADGSRVRKVRVNGAQEWERIYLGSYEIYREKTSAVTQLERQTLHVMDGAKRIAMVETLTIEDEDEIEDPEDKLRYQLGNHLGSAVLEVDEDGLIISYEEYTPYGSSAYRSSASSAEVSARRYRYVGLERDDETGLYSMGARYYAAWLGRWTSADPLGIGADGPGLYNYTRGSPVNLVDPGGADSMDPCKGSLDEAACETGFAEGSGRLATFAKGAAERAVATAGRAALGVLDFLSDGLIPSESSAERRARAEAQYAEWNRSTLFEYGANRANEHNPFYLAPVAAINSYSAYEQGDLYSAGGYATDTALAVYGTYEIAGFLRLPTTPTSFTVQFPRIDGGDGFGLVPATGVGLTRPLVEWESKTFTIPGATSQPGVFVGISIAATMGGPSDGDSGDSGGVDDDYYIVDAESGVSQSASNIAEHAIHKHGSEFPEISNATDLAIIIDDMISGTAPGILSKPNPGRPGSVIFFDPADGTIVIQNASRNAPGTIWRDSVEEGRSFFDNPTEKKKKDWY